MPNSNFQIAAFYHFQAVAEDRLEPLASQLELLGVERGLKGLIILAVEGINGNEVVARCVSPGPLAPRKGINVTYARPELPAITEKDVSDLGLASELGADFIALSFVRSAADAEDVRAIMREEGIFLPVIASKQAACESLLILRPSENTFV